MSTPSSYPLTSGDILAEFGLSYPLTSGQCLGIASGVPASYPLSSGDLLNKSSVVAPTLTFSTATTTGASRSATAAPNPDQFGQSGFSNTGSRGIFVSTSSFFVEAAGSGVWPNYSIAHSINPAYMGNHTATITPTAKDSGSVSATTSGSYTANLTRNFQWGISTSYNEATTDSVTTVGIRFGDGSGDESCQRVRIQSNSVVAATAAGAWNSLVSLGGTAGIWNEMKFEDVSGSTDWIPCAVGSYGTARSKGVYYDILNSAVMVNPRTTVGVTTCVIRVTMRNKANTAITFVQDITLQVTRT